MKLRRHKVYNGLVHLSIYGDRAYFCGLGYTQGKTTKPDRLIMQVSKSDKVCRKCMGSYLQLQEPV